MDKRSIYTVECNTKNKSWSKDFRSESDAKRYMRNMSHKYRASCHCRDIVNPLACSTSAPDSDAREQAKRDASMWSDGRIADWISAGAPTDGMTPELVAFLKRRYYR